jgi:ribosomal protein S18 acetylase RimI-like enzyme
MIDHVEESLAALGCPKLELMVLKTNVDVSDFYRAIGYAEEPVLVLSKRLLRDEAHDYLQE